MPELRVANGTLTLAYRDTGGGGNVVVLLHGFPFNSELWLPQIEELGKRVRIIAPDFRGFGGSDPSPAPYSLARLADDAAELLEALDVPRAVVGGLSMGGYVAFEFYRRHRSKVAALLLADTRPDPDSVEARANRARMAELALTRGSAAVTAELLPKLLTPDTRARRPEAERALRRMMDAAAPEATAAALRAMAERTDSRPLLPDISVPVLVAGGTEDALTPPTEMRDWAHRIPNAQVEFIDGAGHVPNLERPDAFNALLLDLLAAATGEPGGRSR
jgi:pimeloyl-ACP methyl ester carboxylesterase